MKKIFGFSLAEALITLLIVSFIAILSAPIITKKSKKRPGDEVLRDAKVQSIVVTGKLEFKDRKGNVIGWINEDGSASFSQGNDYDFNAMSQKQQQIEKTLEALSMMLNQERSKSSNSNRSNERSYRKNPHSGEIDNRADRSSRSNSGTASEPSQEEIQKQLETLLNMMQTQNRQ